MRRVVLTSLYLYYGLAVWCVLCVILSAENIASIDLWGRLSVPAVWLATGAFPYRDYFSYTAHGHPWIDHEWFSGFVFYAALRFAGEAGLTLVKWSALAVMVGAIFHRTRLEGISPLWPFTVLMAGLPVLETGFLTTGRPQIFTFAFFPLIIGLLESARLHHRWSRLAWLLPIGLIWSNVHGGFLAGVGVPVLYAIGSVVSARGIAPRRALPYVVATALSLLPSLITPYGWQYWPFMWTTTSHMSLIDEWQGVTLRGWDYLPSKLLALATAWGIVLYVWRGLLRRADGWIGEKPVDAVPPLVLLVVLYLGFRHVKHQPLFVIAAAIYLPLMVSAPLSRWWQRQPGRERIRRVVSPSLGQSIVYGLPLGLIVAALLQFAVLLDHVNPLRVVVHSEDDPSDALKLPPYPVEAVRFLERSPYHGHLFTPFFWGEFTYWVLYPRFLVSLDGRFDLAYPVRTAEWLNSFYTTSGLDWDVPLRSGADLILLDKEFYSANPNPSGRLEIPSPWVLLYENAKFMVLGHPRAIAQADPLPRPSRGLESGGSGWSVSSFWHPAADRLRFAQYGPTRGPSPGALR